MKENIIAKLTVKDDKYACAIDKVRFEDKVKIKMNLEARIRWNGSTFLVWFL